jgi:hypothetical protein
MSEFRLLLARYAAPAGIAAMLALTAALYWPGLSGSFLFDDFPNIVGNDAVHVTSADWQDWKRAAHASPSHDLPRPLAMLSYAANYYFTGLDPWPMKLSNLLIHLFNGALLFAVLRLLFSLWNRRQEAAWPEAKNARVALTLSCAWLVCPINLSSVLYVVQRMESLAQTFVLAGLLLYLLGRRAMQAGAGGAALCAAGLVLGTTVGGLCKETAVLLPLYAFLIEMTVLRFETASRQGRHMLWALYAVLLLAPAIVGLTWLLPHMLSPAAYAGRPFTLSQRLFTEQRVVADYIAWTLFPRPASLSFYHDDIAVSDGWLSPVTTLGSGLLLAALLTSAAALRRRLPLYSLGIGWYFAAHLLTATIIPLELAFEHRNYFASIGLLLAGGALILEIPPAFKRVQSALAIIAILAFCSVTALRAHEWGNPIRFAYAEALQHPQSPRANYELGRTLTVASGYRPDSKLIDPAMQAFERATALPGSDAASAAGLIIVANHMHREINPEWWRDLTDKLSQRPPSPEDIGSLQSLAACQRKHECAPETSQLLSAFMAAMNHTPPSARLLAAYGAFAANELGDYVLAARTLGDAASLSPDVAGYRIDLARVQILEGNTALALDTLQRIDPARLDRSEAQQVEDLKRQIELSGPMSRRI